MRAPILFGFAALLLASPCLAYLEQATSGTAANSGSIRLLFHLNESSGTTASDAGKYSNNGTLTNFPASPWTGTALNFDGTDDYVNVPSASSLDLTTGLTLGGWVNTSLLGVAGSQTILSKWDEVNGRRAYLFRINSLTGNLEFLLSANGTAVTTLTSSTALIAGTWTHVTATYDGTTMKIFIDGVQSGSQAGPASLFVSPAPVRVGARGNAAQVPEHFLQGALDETRILDFARADFAQSHVYHFNETGTTPPGDSGGYNHAATLNNSPVYTSVGARFGNGLSFNGTNTYVESLYIGPDGEASGMTLEAWIRPVGVTGLQTIMTSETAGSTRFKLGLSGANVQFILKAVTTTTLTSAGTVTAGTLTHVAGTWDGATMRIFIRGVQDPNTVAKSGVLGRVNRTMRVGGGAGSPPSDPFNGTIDEVRLMITARTGFNPGAVINEVDLNPPSGNQWIELYNGGGSTVDLTGWVFKNTSDNSTYTVPAIGTRTIAPGAFVVIELGAGVDTASTYFTLNDLTCLLSCLSNGDLAGAGDTLSVYPNSTINSSNVIDYVAWGAAPPGAADGLAAGLWARGTFVGVAPTAQSVGLLADGNDDEGWKDWGGLTPASKGSSNVGATAAGVVRFQARSDGEGVLASWETALEPGNLGFNLLRAEQETGPYVPVNSRLVLTRVGEPFGGRYFFRDPAGREGDWYIVEDVGTTGAATRHPPVRATPKKEAAGAEEVFPAPVRSPGSLVVARPAEASPPGSILGGGESGVSHLNLSVPANGVYRVGLDELAPLIGPAGKAAARKLVLTDGGNPVPFRVRSRVGEGGKPVLEFYATAPEGKYSNDHVYQIRPARDRLRGEATASRSGRVFPIGSPIDVLPGATRLEENRLYFVSSTEEDLFFWDLVFNQQGPVTFPFTSDALPGPARLRGDLLGVTDAPSVPRDHHVRVRLNGIPVYEGFFEGTDSHRFDAAIPPGLLGRTNALEVEAVGDAGSPYDVFLVNWFEVEAPRRLEARDDRLAFEADASTPVRVSGFRSPEIEIFDVSNSREPVEIVGFGVKRGEEGGFSATFQDAAAPAGVRSYLAVGRAGLGAPSVLAPPREIDLRGRGNRGDYLVLTTPEFRPALEPLLELRRREGLETRVVDVEAIYDHFGGGNKTPEAIRAFVTAAARSWDLPPRYLLLAGGASFDPRGYLGTGRSDLVPTRLFFTEEYHYEAADDGYFTSMIPPGAVAVATGRLPAQSAEEMAAAVRKIVEYESLQSGRPQGRALFIADDRNARSGLPDPTFEAASDALAEGLSDAGVAIRRLSLRTTEDPRGALRSALSEGADLVNFLGHGGPQTWASAGLLSAGDASSLPNGPGSYFTVFSLTCFDGIFTYAYGDSLAWSLVKAEGRGAIAAYSSSTILDPGPHEELDRLLLEGAYRQGPVRLGDLVREVETEMTSSGGSFRDLVDTYNLIGDPALRLRWGTP